MKFQSIWLTNAGIRSKYSPATFPSVAGLSDLNYDTIIIGGGIFGCTTAYKLKQQGHKVALVEARTIGNGTTGFSTAKLSAQQGTIYSMIKSKHNKETARKYYDFNMQGISIIDNLIKDLNINCDFE
jgi:glycine/D-amino acid oxidase-like deaminating enzyme